MGVPKFFRYTSERYPCLNELVKQYQIPDFDNMYLDMNGIIHNCSHPDDSNPHFRISEESIFKDIFHYISILFQIIKPKKLFFMAIDGVAPRAKMNQQRGRRFRSSKEAEKLEEEAKEKGEVLPTEKRFDSNCITPGTVFMARLHEQLKYFVKNKMTNDPLWSKVKVILSGHETPGEGEHKIMDYIRWSRSQPDYDPNTRHCLYGLDADLVMLGMCTHEPHFALLREEVKFGKSTKMAASPQETNFYLLHLTLLREYLEQEFLPIKDMLPFKYDIEKIVDDWVLMGFLVGNDFIPNLPNMHISNDALPLLYKTYMTVLPTLDGYINEAGDLNLHRFEIFMQELAKVDKDKFQDTYLDLKHFEGKTGRRMNAAERKEYKPNNDETFNVNIEDIKANKPDDELQALINATDDMLLDDIIDEYANVDSSEEESTFDMEFKLHKDDYYMNKLDYNKVTDEVLAMQAEGYIRAIQWNLYYYYKGCQSWCWFYPHHYAPFISDIKGFKDLKIEFDLGEPFKPFEQLLAVLPAASKNLLPTPFHQLMTEEESPIFHYYPTNFETDLNGKKNDWEAVVLIPFIDEGNLLAAMMPCYMQLTDEERKRNTHGPMLIYDWTPVTQGIASAPEYFPPITSCHVIEKLLWREQLIMKEEDLIRGMLANTTKDMVFPGFPTTRHLKYTTEVKKCKLRVFDQPSYNENMIMKLIPEGDTDPMLQQAACMYLGKVVWVGWPHLTRAKVISVSNEKMRFHLLDRMGDSDIPEYSEEPNVGNLHRQWLSERSTIIEHNMNRLGIQLGDVKVIIHAVNLKGYKYIVQNNVQLTLEPQWCSVPCGYALQAVLSDVKAYVIDTITKYSTPHDAFPPGEKVFLMTQGPYYGCLAKVVECDVQNRGGRIKVRVVECREPIPRVTPPVPYRSAHHAAAACAQYVTPPPLMVSEVGGPRVYAGAINAFCTEGITPQMLSRITGTVLVILGVRNNLPTENMNKINIGFNLKFNKKNLEVTGYTRRTSNNIWMYSQRCVDMVIAYEEKFPELFDKLGTCIGNDIYFEGDIWPDHIGEGKPDEIRNWLKSQPHSKASRRECGSMCLEPEQLISVAESVEEQLKLKTEIKKVMLQVKMSLLYKPELHSGNIAPDHSADFMIYDRVVCVSKTITVPFGLKGTITGIYDLTASNTVRLSDKLNLEKSYQVLFDETFPGAMTEESCEVRKFYRMLPANMLCISYGRKLRSQVSASLVDQPFLAPVPRVLRREDGHHSAFASYSPTKETHAPYNSNRISTKTGKLATPPQEKPIEKIQVDGTEMLKNLLKISMSPQKSTTGENSKSLITSSWRMNTSEPQPTPPPRNQPANWRLESAPPMPQSQPLFEQTIKPNQTSQPVNLPFPNFQQPFCRGPGANQVPFPQFHNPSFLPSKGSNPVGNAQSYTQRNAFTNNNLNKNKGHIGAFPKNLPTQGPTSHPVNNPPIKWTKSDSVNNLMPFKVSPSTTHQPPSIEKVSNPFVPLQVQASQRRIRNSDSSQGNKKNNSVSNPMPKPVAMVQAQVHPQPQGSDNNPKPNRNNRSKKKLRIAANLPFQMN